MQPQTQVYTHNKRAHTQTHSLTQLYSAHVWNEQGVLSLGNTPLSQRRSGERETHSRRGGRRKRQRRSRRKIESEGGVTWCACRWIWTWEYAADSGGLWLSHYQASVPLLHPFTDLSKLAPHTPTHTKTHPHYTHTHKPHPHPCLHEHQKY